MSEIDRAVSLWDCLSEKEIACHDPFGGYLGRSGASAYNFLMLATASRTWIEDYLENAVKRMTNHRTPGKPLSINVGHIKMLVENPKRKVQGVQPFIRITERLIQVNPSVLQKISFVYINAALSQ